MRTVVLIERVACECRLAPRDADFLLACHRAHVRLTPTGPRGRYRLVAVGYVGTIVAPGCRLVVRPKLPLRNLFHMLAPDAVVEVSADRAAPQTGAEALDFLALRLATLLEERAAAGLHRAYVECADAGTYLQGRLDVAAQLRDTTARARVHRRYDELTSDVPCNQMPRAVAGLLLRSPLLGGAARAALRQALAPFAAISEVALDETVLAAAGPNRLTEAYRPLLTLCRLLASSLTPGGGAGATDCPAFLLPMERVFESYVTRGIIAACAARGLDAAAQQTFAASPTGVTMRPDVIVARRGTPMLVLDAKWKRAATAEDLYQVIAYAAALGVRRALLVSPGRRDRVTVYPLSRAALVVETHALRVVGPPSACARSLRRLGRNACVRDDR